MKWLIIIVVILLTSCASNQRHCDAYGNVEKSNIENES